MKRIILVLIMNLLLGGLVAQEPVYCELPVANTDGFLSAKVNPAALSFGNGGGIGFLGHYDKDGKFEDDVYSLFFNFDGLAYVLDHSNVDDHTILLSSKLFRNFHLGASYNWRNDKYKKGDWSESLLYRPFDFLSLGAVGRDLFKDERSYQIGLAVRPVFLKGKVWDRVSFSSDFSYTDEKWSDPAIGIQTELVNGIIFGGSYSLETETIGANFSLSFSKLKIGSLFGFDDENKFSQGSYYVHVSDKFFRSFTDSKRRDKFYDFKLTGKIVEKKSGMEIGPFKIVSGKDQTISQVIKKIEKLKKNDKIGGIVFKSGNFSTSFANFLELKKALLDFKSTGKKIVFYYENISNVNYAFAASVADEIYLNPLGSIDLKGISVSMPYLKDALNKLGIEVINFRSHEYKTAGNMLSENGMTAAERESYDELLQGLYDELVSMIDSGRKGKLSKSAAEIIDDGPYFISKKAYENGLVDGIIYEDELEDKLKDIYPKTKILKKLCQNKIRYDWSDEKKDKIALIYAVGNIHSGKGRSGKSIGSVTTSQAIKKAREDKSVKGIILRIDSGGGSALASDIIAREIALCKEGKNKKPVIASMGGVAASGGYYIAANADEIIAQPNTITGSIGVVGIFPVMEKMWKKLYVNWDSVKKGEHSDIGSSSRDMTVEEKKMVEESIEHYYDVFTGVVAKARNMDIDEVHKYAKGRVWTGKQALERGLIDKLGGMDVAVQEMKRLAKIKREVDLVEYEADKSKITLTMDMGVLSQNYLLEKLPLGINEMVEMYNKMKLYENEKILMLMPIELEMD